MPNHGDYTAHPDLHRPGVVSATDPGAIGAWKEWTDIGVDGSTSAPVRKFRNATNTGWISLGATPTGAAGGDLAGTYPNPTIKADVGLTGNPTAPTQSAGNNSTRIASTAFVQAAITALIGTAPGVLDTLGEISDAINDDANLYATLVTALAGKQPLDGDLTAIAALARARGDLIVGGASDWIRLGLGTAGQRLKSDGTDIVWTEEDNGFPYIVGDGVVTITTGEKTGFVRVPFTGKIVGWTLIGDGTSGSIVMDSWISAGIPTVGDTIWGGSKPTVASATDASATGLNIAVTKGHRIRHNVDSVTGFKEATLNYHMIKG